MTVLDGVPDCTNFEIYTVDALEKSYQNSDSECREHCSPYIRKHINDFRVEVLEPPPECARLDLRLTVDNPEDLVVCRRVYKHFQTQAPLIPLEAIIKFLDEQPELKALVAPYVVGERLWVKGSGGA